MGLFNIFNSLDTKNNNGLNLIYDGKTKNLLYAYNKKNGKIEGLLQVFYSVEDSSHNPNYKRNDVGLVKKEFFFINGLINGDFKEYDSNGNLFYYIENIKSNSFNFILKFSCRNFYENKQLPVNDGYQINGFLFRYNSDGTFSKAKFTENNNLVWENYYQNGQIIYDSIERKCYYANGQLKEDLKSGEKYYEDGVIKKTKNGEKFYNNGQLKKNLKSGEKYCDNGQLKFDLINGREYYENGQLKIKNDFGAKYLISEKLSRDNFKVNYSFTIFIKSDTIISDFNTYNYYKNILIYNEKGELYDIEQIIEIYSQENYFQRINRIRKEWRDRGGHISISQKTHSGTKYSKPLLINNFCFILSIEYYYGDWDVEDTEITTHLNPYTGLFDDLYYKNGISIDDIHFLEKEKKPKFENNETLSASEIYQRALEKDANNDYEGAIIDLTKAIEIDEEFIDAYRNRASIKCSIGNFEGAINDYTKIIAFNPDDVDALEDRGRAKYSLKDYVGAIEDFDEIIAIDIETKIYSLRGKMKRYLLDYDKAMLDYDIAVNKFPNDFYCVFGRGELKYEMANYHSAIEDFNKCIELKPKLILSFQKLGECRLKIEDYKGAIEVFSYIIQNRQEAHKIDGLPSENASKTLATYYYNRGVARSNIKDYKNAISDIKSAVELNPEFEEAKYLLKSLENNY